MTLLEPSICNTDNKEVDNIKVENRKYKHLTFTLGEWEEVKQRADECHMKTATYIKYMALNGKIVNVDMENANSILGALSRIEKSVTDSRLKCLMDYLLSITDLEQHSKSDQDHS